jgi:hypothetical protein
MDPSGKKLTNTLSPHDFMLQLTEAVIPLLLSALIGHPNSFRADRAAARNPSEFPMAVQYSVW